MTSRYDITYYGVYVRMSGTVLALDFGDGAKGQYATLSEARKALDEWWPKYQDATDMWVEKVTMHELNATHVRRGISQAEEPIDDYPVNQ